MDAVGYQRITRVEQMVLDRLSLSYDACLLALLGQGVLRKETMVSANTSVWEKAAFPALLGQFSSSLYVPPAPALELRISESK